MTHIADEGTALQPKIVVYEWDEWQPGEGATEDYQKVQRPVFLRDQRLVVVAEKDLFKSHKYQAEVPTDIVLRDLHFVELTILEQRLVHGDYRPKNNHFGYRAKGSDGWFYTCQWDHFDDCSMSAYDNWHREFLEGTHYTLGEDKKISKWHIPEVDFLQHYLNWRLDHNLGHWNKVHRQGILDHANKLFPNTQLSMCHKRGKSHDGREYDHSQHGAHYANQKCFYCKNLANQIIGG